MPADALAASSLARASRRRAARGEARLPRHARGHDLALHGSVDTEGGLLLLDVGEKGHSNVVHTSLVGQALEHLTHQTGVEDRDARHRLVAGQRQGPAQAQGSTHQARRLLIQALLDARTHQDRVGAVVGLHALLDHLLKGRHAPRQVPVGNASLDEIGVHVDVGPNPVLPREVLHQAERIVQFTGAVHELHQQREREVARRHALGLHARQQAKALLNEVVLRAAVEQRVVHDLVRLQLRILLHLFQDLEATLDVAGLAVALDHGAVGDEVGLDVMRLHVLEDRRHAVHAPAARAGVDERVVGDDGEVHVALEHLVIDRPDTVHLLLAREALEHRAVDHRVQRIAAALVLLHLVDEFVGALRVAVTDDSLDHAAERDACGADVAAAHLLPATPDTIDVPGVAIRLDQAPKSVRAVDGEALRTLQLLQLLGQEVRLADAHAGLHHRGQEHLVHGLVHVADQLHGVQNLLLAGASVQALEQDGASHLVRLHPRRLHLLDDGPDLLTLHRRAPRHEAIDQLVEGDAVRLQALAAHLLHEGARLVEALLLQVRLDEGIVRYDVIETHLLDLPHPGLGGLQVAALHAGIEDCIVHHAVQFCAALF
mmetsp:Transcript_80612/g.207493  ORF Transcript_80612/g.207493 Transcript_80612/m.207493 type:complete len:600 (+) Transcript_80612:107-1906(+)